MEQLGLLRDWLAATAESATPQVRLSSGFPFTGHTYFITPPRHTWPPEASGKVRWKAARLAPITLAPALLREEDLDPDRWVADAESECLLPVGRHGAAPPPFRVSLRSTAPVDRLNLRGAEAFSSACLEFTPGSGIWCMAVFSDDAARHAWNGRVRSAFRLLADSGIGGERSRGWGRSRPPQFQDASMPEFIAGESVPEQGAETGYWLVSMFAPSPGDVVDWRRGDYAMMTRSGRVEGGALKRPSRMVEEGSVIFSTAPPVGTARNVAPEEFRHPVYRSGFAVAAAVPVRRHGIKYRSALAVTEAEPVAAAPAEEPAATEFAEPDVLPTAGGEVDAIVIESLREDAMPVAELAQESEPSIPIEEPAPEEPPVEEPGTLKPAAVEPMREVAADEPAVEPELTGGPEPPIAYDESLPIGSAEFDVSAEPSSEPPESAGEAPENVSRPDEPQPVPAYDETGPEPLATEDTPESENSPSPDHEKEEPS
jgi:hypothetical protein